MKRKEIKREGAFSSFFCFLYFQIDFIAMAQKRATAQGNKTTYFNHIVKISMAKEVAMTENNENEQ